jgi:hypothetical protein
MIWPGTLVYTSLLNIMHSLETTGTQGLDSISRGRRFFAFAFIGYFSYSRFLSPELLTLLCVLSPFPRFLAELPVHRPVQLLVGLLDRAE